MAVTAGIYINPRTPGPDHDVQVVREVLEQVELADRLGFSAVWLTEHAFDGQSAYSDPIPLAAYLAGRVRMPVIGFSVAVIATHHPVRFATQVAELDVLSEGRLVLGIGTGLGSGEYRGYGANWERRVPQTREALQVVLGAWQAEDGYEYHGEFFDVSFKGRILPRLVQRPHPPIVQATGRMDVLYDLGREGHGALLGAHSPAFLQEKLFGPLVAGLEDGGHGPLVREAVLDRCGVLHQVVVLEDGQSPDVVEPYLEYFKTTFGPNRFRFDEFGPKANFGRQEAANLPPGVIQAFNSEDSLDFVRHQFTIGTADEVFERLAPQVTEGGARHLMVWTAWGLMPQELVLGSIRRFGERVLPRLAALEPAPVQPVAVAGRAASPAPVV